MFDTIKLKYKLNTKDYLLDALNTKQDVDYLLAHYYRTRLNTKFDIIIIIPTIKGSNKVNLVTDLYNNSKIDWWDNLDKYLPALDIIDAVMNDVEKMSTGKREKIIDDALLFQKELNTITNINLKKYISDYVVNPVTATTIKTIWEKQEGVIIK